MYLWLLDVIQLPDIYISLSVDAGEQTGVDRVPLHVEHVVLRGLELQQHVAGELRVVEVHGPVERARQKQALRDKGDMGSVLDGFGIIVFYIYCVV